MVARRPSLEAATAPAAPGHWDDTRKRVMELLVAAAGDGIVTLNEVDALMGRVLRAPDDEAIADVLSCLPARWVTGHEERLTSEVEAKKGLEDAEAGFRSTCRIFGGVSVLCATIWFATGAGYPWPVWPAMGTFIPVTIAWRDARSRRSSVAELP